MARHQDHDVNRFAPIEPAPDSSAEENEVRTINQIDLEPVEGKREFPIEIDSSEEDEEEHQDAQGHEDVQHLFAEMHEDESDPEGEDENSKNTPLLIPWNMQLE